MFGIVSRICLLIVVGLNVLEAQIIIEGKVVHGESEPVASARVKIESEDLGAAVLEIKTGNGGHFEGKIDSAPGNYFITVSAEGFQKTSRKPIYLESGSNDLTVGMNRIELFSIDVSPQENEVSVERIEMSKTLTVKDILDIPSTKSEEDIGKVIGSRPGAVVGPAGRLHFGGPANQNNWLLNGFLVNDPVSGSREVNLSPEAVSFVDISSSRSSVTYGRGFDTLKIYPAVGSGKFHYGATNFFPGIDFIKDRLTLTNWRPRFSISGPIGTERLTFSNSLAASYRKKIIYELDEGNATASWEGNNLLNIKYDLSPANIISGNILTDMARRPKVGLSPIHALSSTYDGRDKIYVANIKNSRYFSDHSALEIGYGYYSSAFRQIPETVGFLEINPFDRKGSYPFDALRTAERHQLKTGYSLPDFNLAGNHSLQTGLDLQHLSYCQDIKRTGFMHFRVNGTISHKTEFGGNGAYCESNNELAYFWQDKWKAKSWLVFQLGARFDKDSLTGLNSLTYRYSAALMPPQLKNTKLVFGFSRIPSPIPLQLFAKHHDQYSLLADFNPDGTLSGEPFITRFSLNSSILSLPTLTNLSFGAERKMPGDTTLQVNYLRKRSRDEYTFIPKKGGPFENPVLPEHGSSVLYELRNGQKVIFDSLELNLEKRTPDYRWLISYTRSRGRSNTALNAFLVADSPIIFSDTNGPMPWDMPDRFISQGYFKLSEKNGLSYHWEWRTGFPFTSHNDEGRQVGEFNTRRFPNYLTVNIHYERNLVLLGHRWAVRLGCDNCTDSPNPSLVNANLDAPGTPLFYGENRRKPLVVRIRWLGKNK